MPGKFIVDPVAAAIAALACLVLSAADPVHVGVSSSKILRADLINLD